MIHLKCGGCGVYFEFEQLPPEAEAQLPPGLTMKDMVIPLCPKCFRAVVGGELMTTTFVGPTQ